MNTDEDQAALPTAPVAARRNPFAAIQRPVERLAAALSRPHFLRFDAFALWFYACCLGAFLVMSALHLHGSCINIFRAPNEFTTAGDEAQFCQYRGVRVDEWNYHTPAILNQMFRDHPLMLGDGDEGPGKAMLLANVPCRHFTQLFRPQFWGFHFLRVELAFSVYWQAKALWLLTGTFTLFLLLTGGASRLSAFGALWFFFSAYTQWTYSWPSLLPEMIGLFCWVICLNCYLLVGRRPGWLALAAVGSAAGMINFALCAYPPQQIPLIAIGVFLTAGWVWTQRRRIFTRVGAGRRALAAAGCLGLTAAVLLGFYLDAKPTLLAAANTVYPGQRVCAGGGYVGWFYISHLLDFWKTETHYPVALGNPCETTGYFWLAPVTLFALGRRWGALPPGPAAALRCCWGAFALIGAWMTLPITAAVGHWFLFDHVLIDRCTHALGLVNVAIVVLTLCRPRREEVPRATLAERAACFAGWAVLVFLALGTTNTILEGFYPLDVLAVASLYAAWLALCTMEHWKGALAASLLLPLIVVNGPINPLARNLHVITKSALFEFAQRRPEYRQEKWLVFSPGVDPDGFIAACGIKSFNSLKVVPQLADLSLFDPEGKYAKFINQSGYLIAHPLPEGEPSTFESPALGVVVWNVSPLDPRLKQMGIHHAIFNGPYPPEITDPLKPLAPGPVSNLLLYELP